MKWSYLGAARIALNKVNNASTLLKNGRVCRERGTHASLAHPNQPINAAKPQIAMRMSRRKARVVPDQCNAPARRHHREAV